MMLLEGKILALKYQIMIGFPSLVMVVKSKYCRCSRSWLIEAYVEVDMIIPLLTTALQDLQNYDQISV
jgi:hypothetical protein